MSAEYNQCFASCPASTVTIQPPPFVLTIPGPALYCPDQPLCIEQYNPCARMITSQEGATLGGYGATSRLSATGIYSQKMQSGGQSGCNPCQRF